MVREKAHRIFGSRVFYMVFSILASVTIWLYVAYVENPDVSVNVQGVKIEFINEEFLNDKSLVVTKTDVETVSLRFTGRRNTVTSLTNENLKVTADLAGINSPGIYQLRYSIVYPLDINQQSLTENGRSNDFITVTVDTLASKDIPVRGIYNGGVAEGYQAEPLEITPNTITISGPMQTVAKVEAAQVTVMREKISKTVEDNLPITLLDDSGHTVPTDQLKLSHKTVNVKIPVVMVKTVPLTVKLMPGAGADETNSKVTVSPQTISLAGNAELLKNYNQVNLGTIDLSKFLNTTTQTFEIAIPNGMTNLTGSTKADVTVTISGLDSKHVSATNIQVANVPAGYIASTVTTTADVILRGKTEALGKVLPDNIRIVADLSELGDSTGIFSVLGKVYVDGDNGGVGAVGEYKISVLLTKK